MNTALGINDLPCEVSKIPLSKSWFSFVKITIMIFFNKLFSKTKLAACSLKFVDKLLLRFRFLNPF